MMRTVHTLAITLALLVTGSSAFATDSTSQVIKRQAPKSITASFYTCVDKAGSDATAQGACLSAEKKTQDARLNTTYKALNAKLTGNAKANLLTSERAWLEFHNKNGDFEASLYGDEPVADLQVTQNEIFRIAERADALDKYLTIANDQ
ncbi:lysozyme inhibitor LprI family protein [Luteibacter sp. OK325]|uniref:lysozyme inhibitor LprI family protein n=1 Tax=Luteibacter sp. OK325 TaxID=2135670 RepID=UPI001E565C40|nr:lysozyme inhibitor LprI family protein [Luteibacter sp. OK325]